MTHSYNIYHAQPIDMANTIVTAEALKTAVVLRDHGYNLYRPATAWVCGGDPNPTIQQINLDALRRCDAVVAHLPAGVVTYGVPMEIAEASRIGIPTVVINDARSFALTGMPHVTVINEAALLPETLEEVLRERAHRLVAAIIDNTREPIVYQKLHPATPDLKPALHGDAGYDLTTTEEWHVPTGEHTLIPCGIKIELPPGTFGHVLARSSTMRDWGLLVLPGVIDNGYRGPYYASVYNTSIRHVTVPAGTRLCQVVLLPSLAGEYTPVEGVVRDDTERGARGFGSTNGHQKATP